MPNTYSALPHNWSSGESQRQWTSSSRNRTCHPVSMARSTSGHLIFLLLICLINSAAKADGTARNGRLGRHLSTTPLSHLAMEPQPTEEQEMVTESPTESPEDVELATTTELPPEEDWQRLVNATEFPTRKPMDKVAPTDSLLLRLARRFASGNELWDGLVRDCYLKPDVSCFQKNVFSYLDTALDVQDVNVTQRLKFFKNQVDYQVEKEKEEHSEARAVSAHFPVEFTDSVLPLFPLL
ncbi:GD19854 [Drosophila simulans]|uniref:GD19854 n=1 Tax=Drosophila simulans TaxID=7240 RepID=B4QY91_DROSI|nr:GD19854 [Drosophila simulans]